MASRPPPRTGGRTLRTRLRTPIRPRRRARFGPPRAGFEAQQDRGGPPLDQGDTEPGEPLAGPGSGPLETGCPGLQGVPGRAPRPPGAYPGGEPGSGGPPPYFPGAGGDPDFLQAWTKLARSQADLGNQNEALSIGLTLLQRPDFADNEALNLETHFVIARAYFRLADHAESARYLGMVRELTDAAEDPYIRLDGLEALAMLARLEQDIEQAETLALERLDLAATVYPLPNFLAGIHLQLASFFDNTRHQDKLNHHAQGIRSLD